MRHRPTLARHGFALTCLLAAALTFAQVGCGEDASAPVASAQDVAHPDIPAQDVGSIALDSGSTSCADRPDGAQCDDGNTCTANDVCKAGACIGTNTCTCTTDAECFAQMSDRCIGTPFCNLSVSPHVCHYKPGTKVTCAGQTGPCTLQTCDPKNGTCNSGPGFEGATCDGDKDPCTLPGTCHDGVCEGQAKTQCDCQSDADCASLEDGDQCNGTLFCRKDVFPYKCVLDPASVKVCTGTKDSACATNACAPETGKCALKPLPDGTACDDGELCTVNDACAAGQCSGPTNTCLCSTDKDCASQEDGDLCNGVLFCNQKSKLCELNEATVVACASVDDTDCTKNTCVPSEGTCAMTAAKPGTPCDDGDKCTKGEICLGGKCSSEPAVNDCPCKTTADCKSKENGDMCDGTLFCNQTTKACEVEPDTVISCPTADDTACLKRRCETKTGACELANEPTGTTCDDGNLCTKGEHCKDGACANGIKFCECKSDVDCAAFDDGDLCNGT